MNASYVTLAVSSSAGMLEYLSSLRDPRTLGWPVATDARIVFPLLLSYVYIVTAAGPRWMKDRKPFDLTWAILIFNAASAIVNVFFCYQFLRHTYMGGGYSLFCQGIDYERRSETDMGLLYYCWLYAFVRMVDFLDTFFFVARKKTSQITVLHVVHHFLVVFDSWLYLSYGIDGQSMLHGCLNTFVHVIMYSYYFLAALGPSVRKHLWWKRYLTVLQIAQFVVMTVHMSIPIFYDCGFPKALSYVAVAQDLLGLSLFLNFYIRTYISRRNKDKPALERAKKTT